MARIELTRNPLIRKVLRSRYLQLGITTVLLSGYIFAILAGLIGTPVGNRNFSITFVWIAWWGMLILIAVPFLGRGWCALCPIPAPGEWLQRGAILAPTEKRPGWPALRVPKPFRNMWLQNISFLMLALFSSRLLTIPKVTGIVLAILLLTAIGLSLIFERRSFCRYLCPVGGFIGLYSQIAPLELRAKDKQICARCKGKPCYHGSVAGYGCPWGVFPGGLTKNTSCGLCLECLRTCPHDNLAVNLRPFAADLANPSVRLDEAFKAFIMLGSAMVYAGVLLGPWSVLKDAAYNIGTAKWFIYALTILAVPLIVLPGFFASGIAIASHLRATSRENGVRNFTSFSAALIPLGLTFWAAFSVAFVLTNVSYVAVTLSDPLGLGWNLFGTANVAWRPGLTSSLAPIQTSILVGGLFWAVRLTHRVAQRTGISPLPSIIYCFVLTSIMLWLLL